MSNELDLLKALRSTTELIELQLSDIAQLTAERDRLQKNYRAVCGERNALDKECDQRAKSMRLLAAERDRLRAAIDEAPHDENECDWVKAFRRWQSGPQSKHDAPKEHEHCTCWKREVITPRN